MNIIQRVREHPLEFTEYTRRYPKTLNCSIASAESAQADGDGNTQRKKKRMWSNDDGGKRGNERTEIEWSFILQTLRVNTLPCLLLVGEEMDQASNLNAQLFCMMVGMKMNLSTEIRTILKLCASNTALRSSMLWRY
ncbi:hypothetical protein CBL_01984 [Carabus blaptoides fortunei]